MKKNNKKAILPIVLYVVAAIIAIYSIFTIYTSYNYISDLATAGSIVIKDQLVDVVNYYVSASMPYVIYALVVWAIGYIINKLNNVSALLTPEKDCNEVDNKID